MFDIVVGDYLENIRKLQTEGRKFQLILINQKKNRGLLQTIFEEMEKILEKDATIFLYSNPAIIDELIKQATREGGWVLTLFDEENEVAKACFKTNRKITTLIKDWKEEKEKKQRLMEVLKGGEEDGAKINPALEQMSLDSFL